MYFILNAEMIQCVFISVLALVLIEKLRKIYFITKPVFLIEFLELKTDLHLILVDRYGDVKVLDENSSISVKT